MKVRMRKSNKGDIDNIYNCHKECFQQGDHWYKSTIQQFVDDSIVIESIDENKIIAVLLQGQIAPCDLSEVNDFIPESESGTIFKNNNLHLETCTGITMLCVLPEYRGKGLAKKLIEQHFKENQDEILCLHTRKSNPAYNLYIKMGYEHIASIKEKYYFPTEDSCFMIKKTVLSCV